MGGNTGLLGRGIPPVRCDACESVWFRLATFLPQDPQVHLPAPLLVCLCGRVVMPRLSGIRSPAEQNEVDRLLKTLEMVRSWRQAIADAIVADVSAGATLARITRLERSCQLLAARLLPASPARMRPRLPRRVAATQGLDAIALELQRAGLLNFRQARRVVWAVRDRWKAALVKGESVETPLGSLSIRKTPSGRPKFVLELSSDLPFEVEVNPPK